MKPFRLVIDFGIVHLVVDGKILDVIGHLSNVRLEVQFSILLA